MGVAWGLGALAMAWLLFGAWGVWKTVGAAPASGAPDAAQLEAQRRRIGELEQQVATLTRSDQISRDANADLQGTLCHFDFEPIEVPQHEHEFLRKAALLLPRYLRLG